MADAVIEAKLTMPLRRPKNMGPGGARGHELPRPKRVSGLPASGMRWAMSLPVACGGVQTRVFLNDCVVNG